MKNLKKVLALVLAVVMIMGTVAVASAKDYADIKADSDYAEAIDVLSNLNILDGFKNGETYNFQPDGYFTRAQAAKIVAIVHNAATNGKIKGQDAISSLYSNAQNPFVDCNNSWALPFINYCRITGLADGMTKTTYAPERRLTGVQWLKLMLTTLNFDTAKEGYTGTGWDVNVLNRANEVGLTAGLADGWKAIAPIKRGEAAQILYNALTKYLVEYGQKVKNTVVNTKAADVDRLYYTGSFISNEQVAKSGYTLAEKMGISITRATDKFRRPGYTWSYAPTGWVKFYMDAPVASYETAVTECTILKALGIAENKTTAITLNGYVGGDDSKAENTKATKLKVDGKTVINTALNYYAVDGYKFAYRANTDAVPMNMGVTLQHKANKSCQSINGTRWTNHLFGGQGDLTQVFETEDGYVITTIHTFLAEVTDVNKNNKYSHATAENATVKVYVQMKHDAPIYTEDDVVESAQLKAVTTVDYAKGTKVLVNLSLKKDEQFDNDFYYSWENQGANKASATVVGAAESKTGKLTGASGLNQTETVYIDGTKYNTNCRFVLGKDAAMNILNNNEAYTFYFDTYGNVIGREAVSATSNYVVMDKIYAYIDKGVFTIKADLYDLSGNKLEDVTVSHKAGAFKDFTRCDNEVFARQREISIYEDANDVQLTDALYTYTVDDKGVYTLSLAGACFNDVNFLGTNASWFADTAYGRYSQGVYHAAKVAYLTISTGAQDRVLNLTESTKFVVKHGTKWETYTGYTALPGMIATYIDFELDSDGYASIVYIGEASYFGDNFTAFVPTWKSFRWINVSGKAYAQVDVYVDGELKTVNVLPEATFRMNNTDHAYNLTNGNEPGTGMYKFFTKVDENGNVYVTFAYEDTYLLAQGYAKVSTVSNDVTAFTVGTDPRAFNVTGTTIYLVNANGTIEKVDSNYIDGAYVMVYGDKDNLDIAVTIYAFDKYAFVPATQP